MVRGDAATTWTAVETAFREVTGQAVATLTRLFGDVTVAEDAVQDAFEVAAVRWHEDGIPANPAGWIITTAKRRAIDRLRRDARGRDVARLADTDERADDLDVDDDGSFADDRLRLIFTCCHPSLRSEHQIALTLRLVAGLSVAEISQAFLVSESTMAKRLVRAKYKIRTARIPYRIPAAADLPTRLGSVLTVLSLVYNAGHADPTGGTALRAEAIRLARALVDLLPDEPEVAGLLALMLLNESRMPARTVDGDAVLLRDQDRAAWDRDLIEEGQATVRRCIRVDRPGPFQLQAAIQAVHCHAESPDDTDWAQIVTLYDHLASIAPSPIVQLNRAIAVSEVDGADRSLGLIDTLDGSLDRYSRFHTARATMLTRLGRSSEARTAFHSALALATTDIERRALERELDRARADSDSAAINAHP